jgi:protein gp37
VRFISFEPLLEEINKVNLSGIDWAIIGGESGHHYRPIDKRWVQSLIKQCKEQKVKVFFKQWGGIRPKSGGRMLNSKTYSEYPKPKPMSDPTILKLHERKTENIPFKKQQFKKLVQQYVNK